MCLDRSKLNGSDIHTIFSAGEIHILKQITIDKETHKLYVCDREGMRVFRSNLDGTGKEVLVQAGEWHASDHKKDKTRHCIGIAVDATHFYWTPKGPSKGGKGRIFRTNIKTPEGETAETRGDIKLLFDNLPEPVDLLIDQKEQRLY